MTKRPVKQSDGLYHIKGKTYKIVRGSRAQVWNQTAYKTPGGLLKNELTRSHGRIVSLKKSKTAKKEKRLEKAGYFTKKGQFGSFRKSSKSRRSSKKGGNYKGPAEHAQGQVVGGNYKGPLSPALVDGGSPAISTNMSEI
jgi:hypothetical protein